MIKAIKFVSVPTQDQQKALEFWTNCVGFKVATDQPMGPGKRWIELMIPGAETRLVLFTPEGQEDRIGSFFNGSFVCDSVEHSYKQLMKRGVKFKSSPAQEAWGEFAIFEDPDGNSFVLSSR